MNLPYENSKEKKKMNNYKTTKFLIGCANFMKKLFLCKFFLLL